jgi:hypothetical protein
MSNPLPEDELTTLGLYTKGLASKHATKQRDMRSRRTSRAIMRASDTQAFQAVCESKISPYCDQISSWATLIKPVTFTTINLILLYGGHTT